ncbi:MAG: Hsp20/alpha crystallin family protein [Clostridia bacterium]|nr:Hsp20/alpha crystallin family protein [Clostridia bacterium]
MYINNISPAYAMGHQSGFSSLSGFPSSQVINYGFIPTTSGWRAGASYPAISIGYNPGLGWHTDMIGQPISFWQPVSTGFVQPIASSHFGGIGSYGSFGMGMAQPMTSGFQGAIGMGGIGMTSAIAPTTGMIQPRVELAETNSDIVVTAELPNINPNNLQLTVTDDSLSISALALSGGMSTSLHRTVALPSSVRAEHVDATYNNGILEVRLPKSDLTARRRVKVNVTG